MTTERSMRRGCWRAVGVAAGLALAFAVSAAAEETIIFFHQDALGSVRLVTGNNGEVLARHDYLPFGEELPADEFGRASTAGYGGTDGVPQRFTGKERDTESNLDYFGARYYSGAMGRWTSPDPLLNSARPWAPQTFNRYTYVLNNPTGARDPAGLYEWSASGCASGDTSCEKRYGERQKTFRSALSKLKDARDSFDKKSRAYKRLDAALRAYGKEGVPNGVSVGFGAIAGAAAGVTTPSGDGKSFSVKFDPTKWASDDTAKLLAADAGQEGTHVSDIGQTLGGRSVLSDFATEYRGYETESFVLQGLFPRPPGSSPGGMVLGGVDKVRPRDFEFGGSIIWSTAWGAADEATVKSRDAGIAAAVMNIHGFYETTPHNPWGD